MKKIVLLLILISQNIFGLEKVQVTGQGFHDEFSFSDYMRSHYDALIDKWEQKDSGEIEASVYVPSKYEIKAGQLIQNPDPKGDEPSFFFSKKTAPYVEWGIPTVFVAYGAAFWDWGNFSGMRFRDEGWFGGDTYAGGTDKVAHMYSHYLVTRMSYYYYRRSGFTQKEALTRSFIMASSIGLLIEVGDSISHYGFSYQDLISDLVGIGLGTLLNSNAYLNELIGFQIRWWPNNNDPEHKGHKFNDPIDDYNNQKYILNFRMAAIPYLNEVYPLRYVNLDLGYYSRGFVDSAKGAEVKRELFVGLSLNVDQLLRDIFPHSTVAKGVGTFSQYYQIPGTGYEVQSWRDHD